MGAHQRDGIAWHGCQEGDGAAWLVVNGFLRNPAFKDIYDLLLNAAVRAGLPLRLAVTTDLPHQVNALRDNVPDKVIFWDKDVVFARTLECAGVRLFNTARAIALCDDKALTAVELEAAGIPIPRTLASPLAFAAPDEAALAFALRDADQLGYPLVLKEVFGSFGQAVQLIAEPGQLIEAVRALGTKRFILQEYIAESAGTDIRVAVVGGRVAGALRRRSRSGDFRSNIGAGGTGERCDLQPDEVEVALAACEALGLDFAGVDLLGSERGPLVCEVNSNPHFRGLLQATGVNMADAIIEHVGAA